MNKIMYRFIVMRVVRPYSIISPLKESLNPAIIDEDGKVHEDVRIKILKLTKKVVEHLNMKPRYVWMIGSILTYQYNEDSDVDVTLSIKNLSDEDVKRLNTKLNYKFNEKSFINNKHPINFHIITQPYSYNFAEAIYDLVRDKWVKKPQKIKEQDIDALVNSCVPNIVLERLLGEYLIMESVLTAWSKGEINIDQVEKALGTFVFLYEQIKQERRGLYQKGTKGLVPRSCAEIIYKITDGYGFSKLYKAIKEGYANE